MPHPANYPFTVEIADAHPQVGVSRRRSRSNAVLHTNMLFRSSSNSATRVKAEGAERVRIAITGPEATAFGIPTFGERTSITITHRDVNHALRTSLHSRNPYRPVRFVTVAPIPEAEVLPPPTTSAIDLPLPEAKPVIDYDKEDYSLLVPPNEREVTEQYAQKVARQRISDHVQELLEEKEVMRTLLTTDSSFSSDCVPFPCLSPTPFAIPERPSAPAPLSPYPDEDDEEFPFGFRPGELRSTLVPCRSFSESSMADSAAIFSGESRAPTPVFESEFGVLKKSDLKNNSASSLLLDMASTVASLTDTLKLKLASPKSRSTSDLTLGGLEYIEGAPLERVSSGNSALKRRLPVVKKLFDLKKDRSVVVSKFESDNVEKDSKDTVLISIADEAAGICRAGKVKGRKRQRDDDEGDENVPPTQENERLRLIKGRNIRRRLVA